MSTGVEILLVEDNPSDRELIIRALKKGNLLNELTVAKDGQDAIDFLFNEEPMHSKPKLVLLDLKLPKLGGFEVLRKIRGNPNTKTIPVVVMTSSEESSDIKQAYELGANGYIVKPFGMDRFAWVVSTAGLYWLVVNHGPE